MFCALFAAWELNLYTEKVHFFCFAGNRRKGLYIIHFLTRILHGFTI